MNNSSIRLDPEVSDALAAGVPVIALESNVITSGLDYPTNLQAAREVHSAIREQGAVPATTALVDGEVRVGLDEEVLQRLASGDQLSKVSNRDIGAAIAERATGGTTVAASLAIAELAGIRYFASAGLGGVHRGAVETMDISADLIQLTRSRVVTVCAGVKNILDIELTLEYLETHGVPVIAYRSDDFPAFYCRTSGQRSPHRMDSGEDIHRAAELHWAMGHPTGVVVTVPPDPAEALDFDLAERAVQEALLDAKGAGISGKGVTRHLMKAVDRFTDGRSAQANHAVLVSTARAAAEIAVAAGRGAASSLTPGDRGVRERRRQGAAEVRP